MNYLKYLVEEIHTVVAATTDDQGLPITCAIDMMDADENSLYFLTAKGKGFYDRLKRHGYMALTGMKGEDTMSCVAVSARGKVCELGEAYLPRLFEKNPYMNEIYPTEESHQALTVFKLCCACESVCPQACIDFTTTPAVIEQTHCLHCGNCKSVCPQNAVVRRG